MVASARSIWGKRPDTNGRHHARCGTVQGRRTGAKFTPDPALPRRADRPACATVSGLAQCLRGARPRKKGGTARGKNAETLDLREGRSPFFRSPPRVDLSRPDLHNGLHNGHARRSPGCDGGDGWACFPPSTLIWQPPSILNLPILLALRSKHVTHATHVTPPDHFAPLRRHRVTPCVAPVLMSFRSAATRSRCSRSQ